MTDLVGDGIFAGDGDKWQHQRKVATREINTKAVKDFSLQVFQSNAVTLARVVSEAATSNKAIDFQEETQQLLPFPGSFTCSASILMSKKKLHMKLEISQS
ncbi:hypothetical protein PIB30_081758 [Stylosanthes scabra]|uniref:Uncharacterized protein n=1 Tax=Stylosanthes scabra TaxID=79078 RepID=A0ABU6SSA0_9FABA|nr:hypothetical protein [Stylosanthes scabra]